jgi:hypothetical protein
MIDKDAIRQRWDAVGSKLDERGRLFAAVEVRTAGLHFHVVTPVRIPSYTEPRQMRVREANMRRLTIAGLIAASTLGAFVPVAAAQNRAPFWPAITRAPVVTEWYSDLPWTQKLGTFRGNEIDQAIVLPYEQLGTKRQQFCTDNKITVQEDCMIETGIVSILSTLRTDTLYDQSNSNSKIKAAAYCKSNSNPTSVPCIEVMLALSFFGTPGDNTSQPIPRRCGTTNTGRS